MTKNPSTQGPVGSDKKALISSAIEYVVTQDPTPILSSIGIVPESQKDSRIVFKMRAEERTASANMYIKNGSWRFHDFGTGEGGSIIDVVEQFTRSSFLENLKVCLDALGGRSEFYAIFDKGVDEKRIASSLAEAKKRNAIIAARLPKRGDKGKTFSTLVSSYPVHTNDRAYDFLRRRGIRNPPPEMEVLFGYLHVGEEKYKRFGVGVKTVNGGGDIHFLSHKEGGLKCMVLGESGISHYQSGKNGIDTDCYIFESKMDYAAAFQQKDFSHDEVIIANSTSLHRDVVGAIISRGIPGDRVFFYNQNDAAGYEFVSNIAKKLSLKSVNIIKYDLVKEYKKDINDLLLDGVKIESRRSTLPSEKMDLAVTFMKSKAEALDHILKAGKQNTIPSTPKVKASPISPS